LGLRENARRVARASNKLSGYGMSIALLAVASLAVIPALVRADGDAAWGAIALGQTIGGMAATLIAYGWWMSGPARIAVADGGRRRTEFLESMAVKLLIVLPSTAVAATVAALVAPASPGLAAMGALSSATVGLSSNWYFIGARRPYVMLLVETVPRVCGTVSAILLMDAGADAAVGLLCMMLGTLTGCAGSAVWILVTTWSYRSTAPRRAKVSDVLKDQRHGLATSLGSSLYGAAPLIIVSLVAPAAQPVFALADKLQRQITVAVGPLVTVLQGWVPSRDPARAASRVRRALLLGIAMSCVLAVVTAIAGPWTLQWLGGGHIDVEFVLVLAMAIFVGLNFLESVAAKVALATLGRLRVAARAMLLGVATGLPLAAVGAYFGGAVGAMGGVLLGLGARAVVESVSAFGAAKLSFESSGGRRDTVGQRENVDA
jgi:hypothetical protein